MIAAKIKGIAPWFGGKRTLAPRIVRELGEHIMYFEPFCGCAAVVFAKKPSRNETVNDLHGGVINLATVLADPDEASALHSRLQGVMVCDEILQAAESYLRYGQSGAADRVDWAFHYFVSSWMARNGVAGTAETNWQLAVRWTRGGGSPAVRFRSAVDSIPPWHERLRNVVILNRDAFDIIPRFEDETTTAIYVDPPYVDSSRSGKSKGAGHSSTYQHDFNDNAGGLLRGADDHERLRDQLAAFKKARIVVSYYDTARVRELYEGWTFVDCACHKNLHVQNKRGSTKSIAPEVLIVNGPSYTESAEH